MGAEAQPLITVSTAVEKPGETVKLSLILGSRGTELRTLKVVLTFPGGLEYVKASLGINAEIASVIMKTTGRNPSPEFELTARDGVLPEGLLVSLDVEITKEAKVGDTLKVAAVATGTVPTGETIEVEREGGEVFVVEEVPVIACFFYMH